MKTFILTPKGIEFITALLQARTLAVHGFVAVYDPQHAEVKKDDSGQWQPTGRTHPTILIKPQGLAFTVARARVLGDGLYAVSVSTKAQRKDALYALIGALFQEPQTFSLRDVLTGDTVEERTTDTDTLDREAHAKTQPKKTRKAS